MPELVLSPKYEKEPTLSIEVAVRYVSLQLDFGDYIGNPILQYLQKLILSNRDLRDAVYQFGAFDYEYYRFHRIKLSQHRIMIDFISWVRWGHITFWETCRVTDMSRLFFDKCLFDLPIGLWDTSNVRFMANMFAYATIFNQDISGWDTSNVTDMKHMFNKASYFNQPIGVWDVSSVDFMQGMFCDAINFNQDLSDWDMCSVKYVDYMFLRAKSFAGYSVGRDPLLLRKMFGYKTMFQCTGRQLPAALLESNREMIPSFLEEMQQLVSEARDLRKEIAEAEAEEKKTTAKRIREKKRQIVHSEREFRKKASQLMWYTKNLL